MTQTLAISMMVTGLVLLLAVAALTLLLAFLATLLLRESRKIDGAVEEHRKVAANAADIAALEKRHEALDELVSVKLNRIATTTKRQKKEEQRVERNNFGFEFPSEVVPEVEQ